MNSIKVVNIKCGGCEEKITSTLKASGIGDVKIDIASQTVSFEGDIQIVQGVLNKLGYPPADSKQAKSLLKKGKSYVSCMLGRVKK